MRDQQRCIYVCVSSESLSCGYRKSQSVHVNEDNNKLHGVTVKWLDYTSEVIYPINGNGKWCKWMDNQNGLKKEYLDLANKVLGIATNFP